MQGHHRRAPAPPKEKKNHLIFFTFGLSGLIWLTMHILIVYAWMSAHWRPKTCCSCSVKEQMDAESLSSQYIKDKLTYAVIMAAALLSVWVQKSNSAMQSPYCSKRCYGWMCRVRVHIAHSPYDISVSVCFTCQIAKKHFSLQLV